MCKKIYAVLTVIALFAVSCDSGAKKNQDEQSSSEVPQSNTKSAESYDPKRGVGKYTSDNLKLGNIDSPMATKGESIAGTKCTSCHKLSEERLVGPGWKGVTERRAAHWIMNFITNPDPMIDKDPALQAQLELCLVRMPNQNLADEEARAILEYMRKNDGAK